MCTLNAGVVHQGLEPSHSFKQIPQHLGIISIISIAAGIAASCRSGSSCCCR
jgi:hypothetical protein